MRARLFFIVTSALVACLSSNVEPGPSEGPPAETPPAPTLPPRPPPGVPPPIVQSPDCLGASVPPDQHFVAPGLTAKLVANALGQIRQLAFAPDGVLFGVTMSGQLLRFRDANGNGVYDASEIGEYASFGGNGNSVHIDAANGWIYTSTPTGVRRFTWSTTAVTGGDGEDVITGQPSDGHGFHTAHAWDGYLYVQLGTLGNASLASVLAGPGEYDDNRSLIRRFPLSQLPMQWLDGEIVTQGLRNAAGFTRSAKGKIFAVVNGLDDMQHAGVDVHQDNPGEQVVEIALGKKYGAPFCFTAQRVVENGSVYSAGTQLANENFGQHDDAWCLANSSPPATFIQAHSAPLDIAFFEGQPKGNLLEKYRGGAFIALHGSWDRDVTTGRKVIWMPFDADGNPTMPTSTDTTTTFPYETVFGGGTLAAGAQDGFWSWSTDQCSDSPRFVGVAINPIDGALYVSSDAGGTIYRIGK
jgi:glucose/arabinose dehydrogenase